MENVRGYTFICDFLKCDPDKIADPGRLYDLLIEIPRLISMTPITAPNIVKYDEPQAKMKAEWGFSGTVLFAESHIYFHTWPDKELAWADLTSCKKFDPELVAARLQYYFGAAIIRKQLIMRY